MYPFAKRHRGFPGMFSRRGAPRPVSGPNVGHVSNVPDWLIGARSEHVQNVLHDNHDNAEPFADCNVSNKRRATH